MWEFDPFLLALYCIITALCNVIIVRDCKRRDIDIFDSPLFIMMFFAIYVVILPGIIWATYIILNGTIDIVGKRVSAKKGD